MHRALFPWRAPARAGMVTRTQHRYTPATGHAVMNQIVIDTLQLADNLKEAGFQDRQAEGMARALGGVFAEHVVTKSDIDAVKFDIDAVKSSIDAVKFELGAAISDLDTAIQLIRGDYRTLNQKIDSIDQKFETRIDALDQKIETRYDALDQKFEIKIDALDQKIETRYDALTTQIRFIFAILAMLLALGLIDTIPRLIG